MERVNKNTMRFGARDLTTAEAADQIGRQIEELSLLTAKLEFGGEGKIALLVAQAMLSLHAAKREITERAGRRA